MSSIFLLQPDGEIAELREAEFASEDLLQGILARHPQILAGDQIDVDAPRRWILVSREAKVPSELDGGARWYVDHVLLDQDGIPTLVEVKRSSDTRIRREVVGQMLDYAANAVLYWPVESIRLRLEESCRAQGSDSTTALREKLGITDAEPFWQTVKTNLQAGRIRMVFVADQVPPELRRVVEFLNEQMDPAEVLAVEVRQFARGEQRTLVPRVLGQTADAQRRKQVGGTEAHQWDEAGFFKDLEERRGSEEARAVREILAWARRQQIRIWWGKGKRDGSFVAVCDHRDESYQFLSAWTYGRVEIQFQWLKTRPAFRQEASRKELLTRLNAALGADLGEDAIERRPNFPTSLLVDPAKLTRFLETLEWLLARIRAT